MSMEEILQLKEKLGSKLYNKAISSNSNDANDEKGKGRKKGMYTSYRGSIRYIIFNTLIDQAHISSYKFTNLE